MLLCLAVILMWDAGEVMATCGDYLHAGDTILTSVMTADHFSMPNSEQGPNRPICRGASCRGQHPLPVSPIKVLPLSVQVDAVLSTVCSNEPKNCSPLSFESTLEIISGFSQRVFRPPRS